MRPLRLDIEGFTCFRERQETVDFSRLELFAIAGPTGAGKTSLLDAMIFALFGRVPRTGSQGTSELIALGRDRMSIVLDFRVGAKDYRVARTVHRVKHRPTRAQLERLETDGLGRLIGRGEPLADGVQDVARVLKEILGFDYETFIRAVVLPQGEFAAFLKSPPGKQREILRELLRLGVLEDMRRRATRSRDELVARRDGLERRLEEDYSTATPERVVEVEGRLALLAKQAKASEGELGKAERHLDGLRSRRETTVELERARADLQRWKESWDREELGSAAERLAAADRAGPALVRLEAAREARRRWEDRCRRREAAEADRRKARRVLETARRELARARDESAVLPNLRARKAALDRWLALEGPLRALEARREGAVQRRRAGEEELRELAAEVAAAETRKEELLEDVRRLEGERRSLGWDPARRERLAKGRDEAISLRSRRRDAAAAEERILQLDEELEQATEAAATLEGQLREAEGAATRLGLLASEGQFLRTLREGLQTGGECPVCGSEVSQGEGPRQISILDLLADDEATRSRELEEAEVARERVAVLRGELSKAREDVAGLRREKETVVARQVRSRRESARTERRLSELLAGGDSPGSGQEKAEEGEVPPEEELLSVLAQLEDLAREDERHRRLLETTSRELERVTTKGSGLSGRRSDLATRQADLATEIQSLEEEKAELSEQAGPDPGPQAVEEREEVVQEIQNLEDGVERAAREEREAAVAASEAVARADEVSVEVVSAEALLRDEEARSSKAREAAGFASAAEVEEAAWPSERREAVRSRLDQVRGELDSARRRVDDLGERLEDEAVGAEEVEVALGRVATLRAEVSSSREEAAALRDRLGELRDRAARRERLLRERDELAAGATVQDRLARDLRSDAFQAFLLDESFRELVAGASARLAALVDRYALDLEDGKFMVIDHDHGDQRRSADTLSGGETFLASLALALELSEQVQRAVGAVAIDSLFVDEGFGTLDAETLDTVTSAIEALPRSGRMVGIITHLPELTDRLPDRIVIEPGPDGSRIVLDGSSIRDPR